MNEMQKQTTCNKERIKRDQLQADCDNQKNELDIKRLEREARFQIEKLKNELLQ